MPREERALLLSPSSAAKAEPLCPVFGICGGCAYQHIPYEDELALKERTLRQLLRTRLGLEGSVVGAIVASPEPYHYRSRLDLTMRRLRSGNFLMGFQSAGTHRMVAVDSCPIARPEISDRLPELAREAQGKWPDSYRIANLVVRTGEDGRVFWGGIGRRSLELKESDYLWTEIRGRRIHYSLDTFFQANLAVLPLLLERLEAAASLDRDTLLLDLFAGVGLFGVCLAPKVKRVRMVEESTASLKLMRFNVAYHGMDPESAVEGKVEDALARFPGDRASKWVAIADPPRRGLSEAAGRMLSREKRLGRFLYLSCDPESLARDLEVFCREGWEVEGVVPFDFFPKTGHLEVLACLRR